MVEAAIITIKLITVYWKPGNIIFYTYNIKVVAVNKNFNPQGIIEEDTIRMVEMDRIVVWVQTIIVTTLRLKCKYISGRKKMKQILMIILKLIKNN